MNLLHALALTLAFAPSGWAQAIEVGGTWNVRLNGPDGPQDAVLTLTQTGETLSGALKGPGGESKVQGTQKGKDLAVSFTSAGRNGAPVTLKGTVSGSTVSGPATFGKRAGNWSATRAAKATGADSAPSAPALDLNGVWAFEVTSPFGKGTPTVTFRQQGETLAGTYVGQLGQVPLEGTLKGTNLSFATDMAVAALKVHVLYVGTATKDELKGTIKYGEMGEGTFSARRK